MLVLMEDMGISGVAYDLIGSYLLEGKTQYVNFKSMYSGKQLLSMVFSIGICVLGLVLFALYINDSTYLTSSGTINGIKDDRVVMYSADAWTDLKHKIETDMKTVSDYFKYKLLTIN